MHLGSTKSLVQASMSAGWRPLLQEQNREFQTKHYAQPWECGRELGHGAGRLKPAKADVSGQKILKKSKRPRPRGHRRAKVSGGKVILMRRGHM